MLSIMEQSEFTSNQSQKLTSNHNTKNFSVKIKFNATRPKIIVLALLLVYIIIFLVLCILCHKNEQVSSKNQVVNPLINWMIK